MKYRDGKTLRSCGASKSTESGFRGALTNAREILRNLDLSNTGELQADIFGMKGMALQQLDDLDREPKPLPAQVRAAELLLEACIRLEATACAAGFGPTMRQFSYQAAHLLGQSSEATHAARQNRVIAAKDRQAGSVKPIIERLIRQHPSTTSGAEIARQVMADTGLTVSDSYVRRVKAEIPKQTR